MLVGPSWILRSTGRPRASSAAAIICPRSAPSVSIFEATTIAPAARAAVAPKRMAAAANKAEPNHFASPLRVDRRTRPPGSEREGQQRVDLAAVEDDGLPCEVPAGDAVHDAVDIPSDREEHHRAILHRAHDEEIGPDLERI